ncbi:Phage endopeptidase [Streptococcus pyogenes]|nr:Phage endopeptidase [Streptococcus pyogenes]VGT26863.1 Phage endopeptidase [Streptococcus pyogenes]VGU74418.1 Phage endopeptidase [Streptococcus pyogenes]VHK72705.1 Phage endopeptidase [Streptococcus pyogenes]VHM45311.1 Phage endopeptidase [Streptococcus pyogenes]
MEQIKITGTGTALILDRVNRIFAISGSLTMQWDFISDFKKIDDESSLDEDGELFETAYDLILAAKPKTKINLTSSYFAKEHKIGDYWFEKNGKYQRTWIWDGHQWVKVLDTEDLNPNQRAFDEAMAEIEKAKKAQEEINQRTDKELDEFRETLKNLALPEEAIKKITETIKVDDIPSIKQSFDDLKNRVSETSEESRLTAEILGNNGKTRYNKNLLVGDPNRVKKIDEDFIEIEANDGGFKRGETYTISFSQTCELLQKVAVTLTQANNKGVKLVLTPTKAKMESQTFDLTKDKEVISVYPFSYTVLVTSDWYKSKQIDLNASEVKELALEMDYKEIADAKGATITGAWSDSPQIILDGGKK